MVELERNTRGQSDCTLWVEERRSRLTASNFGSVIKRKKNTFPKSHLQKVLSPATSRSKTPESCLWGKTNEQVAIAKYLEQLKSDEKSVTACTQCGLFINTETPWLGARPDCLLHDPDEEMPLHGEQFRTVWRRAMTSMRITKKQISKIIGKELT